jgi:thiamine biosynthesis protein ThiS
MRCEAAELPEAFHVVKVDLGDYHARMRVTLNGEPKSLPEGTTVADLIEHLSLQNRRIAVELNQAIVPASTYVLHRLAEADSIEIVHFVGGG